MVIQSNLEIRTWSVALNAIHLSTYLLIEQHMTGDVQFCPSESRPLIVYAYIETYSRGGLCLISLSLSSDLRLLTCLEL